MERTFNAVLKKKTGANGTQRVTIPKPICNILGLDEGVEIIVTVKLQK